MLGYACINESLKPKNFQTCRLASVHKYGIEYLRERYLHNLKLVMEILEWNVAHGIKMYRVLSDIVPLATHPDILASYPFRWYEDEEGLALLKQIKTYVSEHGLRLSMHPDQFTVLNAKKEQTLINSIQFLMYHARLLEAMGGQDMILHVGGVYGDKTSAMARFIQVYKELDPIVKTYLRLENDDKSYSTEDVLKISEATGVPICFDYHHHRCLSQTPITSAMMEAIIRTWGKKRPKMHMSSGKEFLADRRHHDYIIPEDGVALYDLVKDLDIDIMVEAKAKEEATLDLMAQFERYAGK